MLDYCGHLIHEPVDPPVVKCQICGKETYDYGDNNEDGIQECDCGRQVCPNCVVECAECGAKGCIKCMLYDLNIGEYFCDTDGDHRNPRKYRLLTSECRHKYVIKSCENLGEQNE